MKKNVLLIIALFIATLNLRPAINSIAPLLEDIRVDLGMSAALASLLTSIPVLCMGLFSPFAAKASSKWGIERVIGYSLLIIGVGTIIRLFTHSTIVLLLSSLIAGIGIATIGPLTSGFIKKHRRAWVLTLSFGSMAMLMYSFTAWLPLIIQEMGYSKSYATLCLTVFVIVQVPVSLLLPIMLKKFPSRRLWMVTESLFVVTSLVLLVSNVVPVVSILLFGLGAGGLFTLNLLLPIDATSNASEATSWSAMQQSAGYVIGASGPILLGWIHDASNSFTPAIIGMIIISIIMIFIQVAATQKKNIDQSLTGSKTAA